MYHIFMKPVIALFCSVLVIDAVNWYSATLLGDRESEFGVQRTQGKQKYASFSVTDDQNEANKSDWHPVTKIPSLTNLNIETYNFNRTPVGLLLKTSPKHETISILRTFNEKDTNKTNTFSKTNVLYNEHNIKLVNRLKTKRKHFRNRSTAVSSRRTIQLNANKTTKERFLEVFQVVEFDRVSCTGSNGLDGECLHEYDCQAADGLIMGTCADGRGTCCVTQFSCDDSTSASMFWFNNPEFPSPSTVRLSCALIIDKASEDVKQLRLDFRNFELLPPNGGSCEQDQFVVSGQNVNSIVPILCGINTGQHLYVDVDDVEGPVYLSFQSVSDETRLFSIKVTQLTAADDLSAPSGCLQYHKETHGHLESFNYIDKSNIVIPKAPSYLNNLNYAMCIERGSECCSVTYTNAGSMQIVNYDADGLPVIPPGQAGVEVFSCPSDWLLISAVRLCGERLNDGSVLQDFALNAPITDISAGPIVVWFRSDGGYVGRGFKMEYQQNNC